MKRLVTTAALCLLAGGLVATSAVAARPHHHHTNSSHAWRDRSDWHNGGYVSHADWDRGQKVDYRSHHLRRPPSGYEWRQVDNNYVLVAVATGLIASIIANSH